MIEPRPAVGCADRRVAVQVANGAFQPDRRRVMAADRRKSRRREPRARRHRRTLRTAVRGCTWCDRPTGRAGRRRPGPAPVRSPTRRRHRPRSAATAGDRRPAQGSTMVAMRSGMTSSQLCGDHAEPAHDGPGSQSPAASTNRRCRNKGTYEALTSSGRARSAGRTESVAGATEGAEGVIARTPAPRQARWRAKVDDTSMNSLRKMPKGGNPAMAMTPSASPTARMDG